MPCFLVYIGAHQLSTAVSSSMISCLLMHHDDLGAAHTKRYVNVPLVRYHMLFCSICRPLIIPPVSTQVLKAPLPHEITLAKLVERHLF